MHKKLILIILLVVVLSPPLPAQEECTVGVAVGRATVDGRPLLWKNRDTRSRNNSLHLFNGRKLNFVAIINSGDTTQVWMGVNTAGFAIMNAESRDMEGDKYDGEGFFMKRALAVCRNVADFEKLLVTTNKTGRTTTANFGVIDAGGNGAIFETGNHTFTKFDAAEAKLGYIVRTNYALTGVKKECYGYERKYRAEELFRTAVRQNKLSANYILQNVSRDLLNDRANPYPLPFSGRQDSLPPGALYTNNSINRFRTASVAVFHGIAGAENPQLTEMWVILGEPVCGIAFPVFPVDQTLPISITRGNPNLMNDLIQQLENYVYADTNHPKWLFTQKLQSNSGTGILPDHLAFEREVFSDMDQFLAGQRKRFSPEAVSEKERLTVEKIVRQLQREVSRLR